MTCKGLGFCNGCLQRFSYRDYVVCLGGGGAGLRRFYNDFMLHIALWMVCRCLFEIMHGGIAEGLEQNLGFGSRIHFMIGVNARSLC